MSDQKVVAVEGCQGGANQFNAAWRLLLPSRFERQSGSSSMNMVGLGEGARPTADSAGNRVDITLGDIVYAEGFQQLTEFVLELGFILLGCREHQETAAADALVSNMVSEKIEAVVGTSDRHGTF